MIRGTTEELIWFIINEHKKLHIECKKLRISYLLLIIECFLMNILDKNSILDDVEYRGSVLLPIECDIFMRLPNVIDLTEWISEKKEIMINNFINKNDERIIEYIRYAIDSFKNLESRSLINVVCGDCPIAKHQNIEHEWYKRHYDEDDAIFHKEYVPKRELKEWFRDEFLTNHPENSKKEDTSDENIYTKDGKIIN